MRTYVSLLTVIMLLLLLIVQRRVAIIWWENLQLVHLVVRYRHLPARWDLLLWIQRSGGVRLLLSWVRCWRGRLLLRVRWGCCAVKLVCIAVDWTREILLLLRYILESIAIIVGRCSRLRCWRSDAATIHIVWTRSLRVRKPSVHVDRIELGR